MQFDFGEEVFRQRPFDLLLDIRSERVSTLRQFLQRYQMGSDARTPSLKALFRSLRRRNAPIHGFMNLATLMANKFVVLTTPAGQSIDSIDELEDLDDETLETSRLVATQQWKQIVNVFGFGIEALAKLNDDGVEIVKPTFSGIKPRKNVDIFVAMPFAPEFDPVLSDAIVPAGRLSRRDVVRGDDLSSTYGSNVIINEVFGLIKACRIVVADCTGRNANVFYELGLAHAIGKSTLIITQSKSDIPFDIKHIRYIEYAPDADGLLTLRSVLQEAFSAM